MRILEGIRFIIPVRTLVDIQLKHVHGHCYHTPATKVNKLVNLIVPISMIITTIGRPDSRQVTSHKLSVPSVDTRKLDNQFKQTFA